MILRLLAWICFLLLMSGSANAHTRSQSLSYWDVSGSDVSVIFNVTALETTRLSALEEYDGGLAQMLNAHLKRTLKVSAGGAPCNLVQEFDVLPTRKGFLSLKGQFVCQSEGAITITSNAFFFVAPSHSHFLTLAVDGETRLETLLTANNNSVLIDPVLGAASGTKAPFKSYLKEGVGHIITGFDHIAFVLCLMLAATGLRSLVIAITGFTLGHSVSLALVPLGIISPNAAIIEALIGASIILVAFEAARLPQKWMMPLAFAALASFTIVFDLAVGPAGLIGLGIFSYAYLKNETNAQVLRFTLTALFGLVHGFGFGSALALLSVNADNLFVALLGFNIGIELGQILIVIAVLMITKVATQFGNKGKVVPHGKVVMTSVLSCLGTYWFVSRLVFV